MATASLNDPEAVRHKAVGEFIARRAAGKMVDAAAGLAGFVHVQGIDLAEIAVRRLHQAEAVLLGLRERLLVRQHDARVEVLHAHQTDDALSARFSPWSTPVRNSSS